MRKDKLNGMRTDQTGKNYRNPSLSMFYQETYNEKFYEELSRMLGPVKKDIYNVLVCGAGPGILEGPLLRALSNIYKGASELNITFVDINKNPFKMLNYTLQGNRSKDDIMKNSDNLEDVELGKWYHIKDTNINYRFKEANLEFDPKENTNVEEVDLGKGKYDAIIMSMLLQHVSYWRSLIAYLNKFLEDDGVFMVNEFAGDDNLLCLNPEQAVKDLGYQVPTEIEKLFIDFIEHPFDIISDNDELAPTNMELLKHFFSTFNSTPTETSHYKIESTLSINDILGLIRNKVFSPFNKYADIFGTDLEDDINAASEGLDKNKQHALTYLLKWYIFKKIKDGHAEDLAEFDVFDENGHMSKEKLEKYINEVNSMLSKYNTIFSGEATTPAYEEIKKRDMIALNKRLHPIKNNNKEDFQITSQTDKHPLYSDVSVNETEDIFTMSKNRDAVYRGERGISVDKLPYSLNKMPIEILTKFGTAEVKDGNGNVLDEACGDGHMTAWMQRNIESNQKYFLHDISKEALKYAQKLFNFKKEQLILTPNLLEDDKKFDKILVRGLYHHLSPKLRQEYSKMYRDKLNNNGIICIASRTLDDPVWKKTREESPTRRKEIFSHLPTGPVDFDKITKPYFNIEQEGIINIKEGTTGNNRKLKVIIARKNLKIE